MLQLHETTKKRVCLALVSNTTKHHGYLTEQPITFEEIINHYGYLSQCFDYAITDDCVELNAARALVSHLVKNASLPTDINTLLLKTIRQGIIDCNKIVDVVDYLLQCGANVNATDGSRTNRTMLMVAVNTNNLDVVTVLLQNQADVHAQDNHGQTALLLALQSQKREIAEYLISHSEFLKDIHSNPDSLRQCFVCAIQNDFKEIAKTLVEIIVYKEDFSVNFNINTLLFEAIRQGGTTQKTADVVDYLLQCGANVNEPDIFSHNQTALMYAVKGCMSTNPVIKLLLQHQADVNAQDDNGFTALMFAARRGNISITQELLRCANVDVNIQDKDGHTALYLALAAIDDSYKVAQCLLDHNADISWRSSSGETLLMHAIRHPIDWQLAKLLVERGVDVHAQANNGSTALMIAIQSQKCELVKVLLQQQVDVNAQDNDGYTALMFAARKGDISSTKSLLSCTKVDVDIQDNDGQTALDYAVKYNYHNVAECLLDHNSDIRPLRKLA